ncbi:TonB-dependent receptor [Sorangium sp. So ce1036]|uniref:TonB-dependent receptor domain-containing protein n=1 Tax=Sorangium sp. So ce1036 TaxID=3133328 RepID=UPI003EFCDE3B
MRARFKAISRAALQPGRRSSDAPPAQRSARAVRRPRARRAWWLVALPLLVGSLLQASAARADGEGQADEADLHFELGRELFKKGEFRAALEHFLASNRLVPNRNVIFNIALTYEELGRFADAHRYYDDALEGEADPEVAAEIQAALQRIAPRVAVLQITTSPPGASIYIDRKDLGPRGRAPRRLAVDEGRYRILVELDGYEPVAVDATEVKLGQAKEVMFVLRRIVGTVRVDLRGAREAAVHVDSEGAPPACVAPCDVDLPPGRHVLYFSRPGYHAAPRSLTVAAREVVPVTATLSPLTGSILVHADERDALIEIDGRPMGFTPSVIQGVPVGRRHLRVSLRGFAPVERTVEVTAGQQAELRDLTLEPLREVSAASRVVERVEDAPASVSVIDRQELRAFGYPTLAEALRGTRGVYLSNDHVVYSAGIRGLGEPLDYGNRLLVLSDGHSTNDNILNASFVGSDARDDLHDVDHIEIVRGPGSLLYGTGALSGIVNLVPRGRDEPTGAHAAAGTYHDSVGHARAGFHYNAGKEAGVRASASAASSDGFDVPVALRMPGGGPRVQVAEHAEAFRAGGTFGRAWYGPITAQWMYHQRKQIVPTGYVGTRLNDLRSTFEDVHMMAEVRYEPELAPGVRFMARGHANRFVWHGVYAFDEESTERQHQFGTWLGGELRVAWTPLPWLRVTGGGEAQAHPEARLRTEFAGGGTRATSKPFRFGAGYLILDGSPAPWVRLSAGARLDFYSTLGPGPIAVPRGAIILRPAPGGVLKIMGGSAFRAPSVSEQFYADGKTQLPAVDPARGRELDPEYILSGEVEYSQRLGDEWVALGAVHASSLSGTITLAKDEDDPAFVRYTNSESPAVVAGGDVELRREWRQGWMLAASYGYQHTRHANGGRLVNAPEHLASFRGVIPVVDRHLSAGLRVNLEAPRRISRSADDVTSPAIVADLTVSGEVERFRTRYVLGLYNAMDARYDYPVADTYLSSRSRQNGRTFLAEIVVSYP